MKCPAQWLAVSMHIPTGWLSLSLSFSFITMSKGAALQAAHQGPRPSSAGSLEPAKPRTPSLPLSQAECS